MPDEGGLETPSAAVTMGASEPAIGDTHRRAAGCRYPSIARSGQHQSPGAAAADNNQRAAQRRPGTGRLQRDRIGELRTRGLDHAIELAQNDLPLGVTHRRDEVAVGR